MIVIGIADSRSCHSTTAPSRLRATLRRAAACQTALS